MSKKATKQQISAEPLAPPDPIAMMAAHISEIERERKADPSRFRPRAPKQEALLSLLGTLKGFVGRLEAIR